MVAAMFDLDALPQEMRGGVVAIGNFDGVHRGHAALIGATVEQARSRGVPAVVLTFDPHPRTFFRPDEPVARLTPLPTRTRILRALGVDAVAVARFDRAFSEVSADGFIADVLAERLAIVGAVVGFNFRYGHRRQGTVELLRSAGASAGFGVTVIDPATGDGGAPIASRAIREALASGDVAAARIPLGYTWFAEGRVEAGDRRGRELGFPTANVSLWPDCGLRYGIYASRVRLADGRTRNGVASFGRRPTFDDGMPKLEVYLFDFDEDIYGTRIAVKLVDFIRGEKRFDSVETLVAAMHGDAAEARRRLASAPGPTDLDRAIDRVV